MKRFFLACALATTLSTPAFAWTQNVVRTPCYADVLSTPYRISMWCSIPHTLTIRYSGDEGGMEITYAGQTAVLTPENPEHTWDVWVMAADGMEGYERPATRDRRDSITRPRQRRTDINFLEGFAGYRAVEVIVVGDRNRPMPDPEDADEDNPVIVFENSLDFVQ